MATIEFWARVGADHTLAVPPEIATQIQGDEQVRVVVVLPESEEERGWNDLVADQFLQGYDGSDDIYDDLPSR
jgi:hypothetical protein